MKYEPVRLAGDPGPVVEPEETLSWRRAALVFGAAVLCHLWMLRLPFQLDDFGLLPEPMAFFTATETEKGITARLMRWPLIGLLSVLRALGPEPLSPVWFHTVGLALHGFTAVVLARCVRRFEKRLGIPGAAVLSGLLFGVAGGHVQAVSWTSAWASLLYPLFGLLALDAFLSARANNGSGRRRLTAGVFLYLSLVSKAPAVVLAVSLALLLLGLTIGAPRGRGAGRHLAGEALTFLVFGGLAAFSRWQAFGVLDLNYYDRPPPTALELRNAIPQGFVALGQALVPWNAKPMFAGTEPISVTLTDGERLGPELALLAIVPWLALALLVARRVRGALFLLLAVLPLCVMAPGLVFQGSGGTNLWGRTTYPAMLVSAALLGIGTAGLGSRSRFLGSLGALWLLALAVDGTVHVGTIERLAGRHRTQALELVQEVAADHAASGSSAELVFFVLEDEPGYAGIPSLGPKITSALRPPFVEPPGWRAHAFKSGADLFERSAELDVAAVDLAVLGPELDERGNPVPGDAPGRELAGARLRERRAWRLHSHPFPERSEADPGPSFVPGPVRGRWTCPRPIQPHTARTLRFTVRPGSGERELDGTLWVERAQGPDLSFPMRVPMSEAQDAVLELSLAAPDLYGPPWQALRWEPGGARLVPQEIRPEPRVPELEYLGVQETSELSFAAGRIPRPRLLFRLPPGATEGTRARLSWSYATRGARHRLFAEAPVQLREGRFAFSPRQVRMEGASSGEFPWGEFCRRLIALRREQAGDLELLCRLVLLLEEGQVTARSAPFPLRFTGAPSGTPGGG